MYRVRRSLLGWSLCLAALAASAGPAAGQAAYTWNPAAPAGNWLDPANWGDGTGVTRPGVTTAGLASDGTAGDTAVVGAFAFPPAGGLGIDLGAAGGQLALGAIHFTSGTANLTVGNSSATNGTLRLNGATVNGVPNVLLANTSGSRNLTVANSASGSGTQTTGLVLGNENGVVLVNPGRMVAVSSDIAGATGTARLVVQGGGSVSLSGANTYAGGTTVRGGTVFADSAAGLGTGGVLIDAPGAAAGVVYRFPTNGSNPAGNATANITVNPGSGGTVTVGAAGQSGNEMQFSGTLTLNRDTALQGGNTFRTRFTGQITGTGNVTVTNAAGGFASNKVVFDNQPATAAAGNSFGQLSIAPFATLQLGNGTPSGNRQIPDAASVTFADSTSALWFAMGGANTGETVNALVSQTAGAGQIKTTITGSSANTFTLTVGAGNGGGTFGGVIGEDATRPMLRIAKTGTGTQVFTGNNTYTGGTAVSGGRLLVNGQTAGNSGTGTGAVSVSSTGTLGGTGRVAGSVDVINSGRVLAGDGTAANQTFNIGGNLTVSNTGGIRVVAGNGANFADEAAASRVAVAGTFNRGPAGGVIQIEVGLDGSAFDREGGTTYTRQVLTYGSLGGSLAPGTYSSGDNVFNVVGVGGVAIGPGWQVLVGLNGDLDPFNGVVVQFTPVPEPATVLAVAAAGLGLVGLARRARPARV